jgi:hypothetical protein
MHRRLPDIVARLDVRTNESQTWMEESQLRIALGRAMLAASRRLLAGVSGRERELLSTVCQQSRAVIAGRFRGPSGASDTPDPTTQARIARTLDKTRRGGLPAPFEAKLYAGPGSLAACDGCGDKIASEEREYEIELAVALTFRFHTLCYHAWKAYPVDR